MISRKYSIQEIDRLRAALVFKLFGADTRMVEEQLRTYMFNGTGPEELEEQVAEIRRRLGTMPITSR